MKFEPKFEITKSGLDQVKAEVLVVFTTKTSDSKSDKKSSAKETKAGKKTSAKSASEKSASAEPTFVVEGVNREIQERIAKGAVGGAVSGAANETVLFRDAEVAGMRHLLVVGLGEASSFEAETIRLAIANAMGPLKAAKVKSVAIAMDSLPRHSVAGEQLMQAMTEGILLAGYSFNEFKSGKKEEQIEEFTIVATKKSKGFEEGLKAGEIMGECINMARWLGDRPGNRMTPTMLANEAVKAAKGTRLKVTVWNKQKIKSENMGSFLSVSLGSAEEPRFIVMRYNGAPTSQKPVCFVGKGLTFDSGGISIKPSAGMEEMKYDMCGGANVIGTMLAIAKLKLKINAIGLVPATENMPGPAANKPGDIVIARNGKSIEVNNTDAEGRLILNDALVYACEQKPAAIFDIATLTGAMVVALGNLHTGFFTRNDKLATKVEAAAKTAGEWVWRMPLTDFHVRDMKGTYADLSNISSSKGAGSATAAAFLEQFVDKDIQWAHFDIAGSGWHSGDRWAYNPRKGATGAMIRTFVQLAQAF